MNPLIARRRVALGVCLTMALMFVSAGSSAAQEGRSVYVRQTAARLSKLMDEAERDKFILPVNAFSIGGGWLNQSTDQWIPLFTVQLTEGKAYRFLAAGDDDTKDLDLEIQDSSGKVVAQDVSVAADAKVEFTPQMSGRYTVRLRLYDSRNNLPCFCFATLVSKD
jgi:hypothetical protein